MKDFAHKYTRRKRGHDYQAPAIYHIILKKKPGGLDFGRLIGDPRITPGNPGAAAIELNSLGKIIRKEAYYLQYMGVSIQVYQYMVMPDHVHLLLRVKERLPKAVGQYIGVMKTNICRKWRELRLRTGNMESEDVFERNFTDRIIYPTRDLTTIFRYIKENPHRLAMRKLYPEFFQRARKIRIKGEAYEAYGNLFHLRNPFKSQVIVHRANSVEENERLYEEWAGEIMEGSVLVSPFISAKEKDVYNYAVEMGGRIIRIQHEAFGERYKPAEREFQLCCEGRMLLIAPVETMGKDLTREVCLKMNGVAEAIAKGEIEIGSGG